jgi:hypothetical protein
MAKEKPMKIFMLAGCGLSILGALGVAGATVRHVEPDGSGDYPTILAAVQASGNGDIIELGNGTFAGDGNRDVSFSGKAITVRSATGDPALCVIDCEGPGHRAFHIDASFLPGQRLEGMTITNGLDSFGGGALRCYGSAPATIVNCILTGNQDADRGGAVFIECTGLVTFIRCRLENSTSRTGGAVMCYAGPSRFEECVFVGNVASDAAGGACCVASLASAAFVGCVFSGNSGYPCGGVANAYGSVTLEDCTFTGNVGTPGSAVLAVGGTVPMENCLVAFNLGGESVSCQAGGAVALTCCDIYGNGADWVGCIASQLGVDGNIGEDPLFCLPDPDDAGDWSISNESPCVPGHSSCGLIGAVGVGCDATPVVTTTWSNVKALYR